MRLTDLKIKYKISLCFCCILSIFAITGMILFSALDKVGTAQEKNSQIQSVLIDIEQSVAAIYDQSQTARGYIISRVERHANLYTSASKMFDEIMARTKADASLTGDKEDIAAIENMAKAANAWRREVGDPEIALTKSSETIQDAIEIAKSPRSSTYMQAFRSALGLARDRFKLELRESQAMQAHALASARISQAAGGLLAVLIALGGGLALYRTIAVPILAMTGAMATLAAGRIMVDIPAKGQKDEIGLMAKAVENFRQAAIDKKSMEEKTARERGSAEAERRAHDQTNEEQREQTQDAVAVLSEALEHLARGDLTFRVHKSLKGTYDQLRTNFNRSAEKLQATMNKVCTNMEAIHVGTRELSSASNDLSQRTEQQATNLQETATALDLITIAIKKAAMGSAHARTVVSSATAQAQEGEGIVRAAIQAMHGIESTSKEIGQILGSIDEIAFQTNLLALNAGVEAARAGDSGRGFAVVAAEVRALAQRSSEAAKEIKSLMSTSARNIGHGVDLVGKAGVALEQIRDQVANINVVVTEIAAGAQQQSASLQEVNTAVSQMDRSTKLNATMVQESSAASHAIAEETDELVSLIGSFVLSGQEENSTPRSARHRMA